MPPTEFVPDWKDTPLKKHKKFAALVKVRKEAAAAVKDAEETKKTASAEMFTLMTEVGVEKVRFDDASISITTTTRSNFDQGKAKALLVEKYKLKFEHVEELWQACTTTSSSSFVSVRGE